MAVRECVHSAGLEGQTVNAEFYCNVLRRLREDIGENDLNCGTRAIGCSMMTIRPLIELW
jgi:hypothetical protein